MNMKEAVSKYKKLSQQLANAKTPEDEKNILDERKALLKSLQDSGLSLDEAYKGLVDR